MSVPPRRLPGDPPTAAPRRAAIALPAARFLATETGGAALLLGATLVALIWANVLPGVYEDLWTTSLRIELGGQAIDEDLRHWVNDGLMVLFFYVVGLEIRRELAMGELTDRRRAAIPALAALAGMVVPALLYVVLAPSGEAARAWGVVMATDIAFALGALALLGDRVPAGLRVFLLTLAIVDDIGAIVVIAVFYADAVDVVALGVAAALVVVVALLRDLRGWHAPAFLASGVALWVATLESGVHPTIAGVVLGVLTAVHPPRRDVADRVATLARSFGQTPTPGLARRVMRGFGRAVSPNERLQDALHPWTSTVVVPVFALANAGIVLDGATLQAAASSTLVLAIVAGLVLGKLIGVSASALLALRLDLGDMPHGVDRRLVPGVGALAGIGFTVSLFIVDLAFADEQLAAEAKVGVLVASAIAAVLGLALLRASARRVGAPDAPQRTRLDPPVDPRRDHVRGDAHAPSTLVVYTGYPDRRLARLERAVRDELGDELRVVRRHLPTDEDDQLAAEAVEAAGAQGRGWALHDRLQDRDGPLDPEAILEAVEGCGGDRLDLDRLTAELRDHVHTARVAADRDAARAAGVTGARALYVGEEPYLGPLDAGELVAALRAEARD